MGDNNSLVVYTTLFERQLLDIADWYTDSSPVRDIAKARSRIDREGLSFLTKALPRLAKHFDRALQGEERFCPDGFNKQPGSTVPKFLGWLFNRVFTESGMVRSDADIRAIRHSRQVLSLVYKLEIPYEEEDAQRVLNSFLGVQEVLKSITLDPRDACLVHARALCTRVLSGVCHRDILPKHGPGSVATGELGSGKSTFSRIYADLEREYPFTEYFQTSISQVIDTYGTSHWDRLAELEFGTAKVVLVPKDSRGPRLISSEPLEKQWIQGGLQRKLVAHLESHRLTKGQVNFTDQSVNRELALRSSYDGRWVTLDMKDASDRVSLQLVEQLYSDTPWYSALVASRSRFTRFPDGQLIELASFAPMGSAVCFPIEALTFWALSVSALRLAKGYTLRKACASVFVYGDDIICRREDYPVVMQELERFGLMFNRDKCCVAGFFRESCGCDAYKGVDVTPTRLRATWDHRKAEDASQLVSYVMFHNIMSEKGYRRVCTYVRQIVEDLYGTLPFVEYKECVTEDSELRVHLTPPGRVIGWYDPHVRPWSFNKLRRTRTRFSRELHRCEVKGYFVQPVYKRRSDRGWEALLRYFGNGSTGRPAGMYAVAHRSRLQRGWGSMA